MELIETWDRRIYDPERHLFRIGTTERRYYDENIGKWVDPGIIPMYPLDTTALKICAYGAERLEKFEYDGAQKMRKAIESQFAVTVEWQGSDGKLAKLSGYDFVSNEDRKKLILWIETGPFGDHKVKRGVGRDPLVSDEWSTWVAFADLRLAGDYEEAGQKTLGGRYLAAYTDNALVQGFRSAISLQPAVLAYPYAQPLPYALNKPVGFGWNTHHVPYSIIGGVARTLGALRFDPFLPDGGPYAVKLRLTPSPLAVADPKTDTPALYTEAELYVREGWQHVDEARSDKEHAERAWTAAAGIIERMNTEHPDWMLMAVHQNRLAAESKDKFPLMGRSNLTPEDVYPVFKKYWALYHVGGGEFIKVMAYMSLSNLADEKGDYERKMEMKKKAWESAKRIVNDYYYAQVYDTSGWLWQPAQSLREYFGFYY